MKRGYGGGERRRRVGWRFSNVKSREINKLAREDRAGFDSLTLLPLPPRLEHPLLRTHRLKHTQSVYPAPFHSLTSFLSLANAHKHAHILVSLPFFLSLTLSASLSASLSLRVL